MTHDRKLANLWLLVALTGALWQAASPAAQRPDTPEQLLRVATDKEVVDGDIRAAIKLYQAIADRFYETDRITSARALMRLAEAYKRLGSTEAAVVYTRIVRDFADQKDIASVARARLGGLQSIDPASGSGPVCTRCAGPFFYSFTMSPDGRWLGYTNENNELVARNLQNGDIRPLVTFPPESHSSLRFRARRATWSRDLRRVAYSFRDTQAGGQNEDRAQLRVLTVDRNETRTLVDNADLIYVIPAAWSADGSSILVTLQRRDFTWQFAWVSVETGALTVLRSLNWQYNEFRSGPELSPDGRYIVYAAFAEERTSPGPNEGPLSTADSARTLHILSADGSRDVAVQAVVNGWPSPVWSPDGAKILFVSDRDRAGSYDLWAANVRDGRPVGVPRLLKASIGANVNLVGATRSGQLYYVQPETTSRRIVLADVDAGISDDSTATTGYAGQQAAWSPDGTRLAWLAGGTLKVRTLESGAESTFALPRGATNCCLPAWQHDGKAVIVALRNFEARTSFTFARATLEPSAVQILGTYQPPQDLLLAGLFRAGPDTNALWLVTVHHNSGDRSLVAFDPVAGATTAVLSGLPGMQRLQSFVRPRVGQAVQIAAQPVAVSGIVPRPDGVSVVIEMLKDGRTSLATKDPKGGNLREIYGPIPLRQWKDGMVSRLSQPRWLTSGSGLAFGVQQDDLSWKLFRVSESGRAEPLRTTRAGDVTLGSATLSFDISPDGRRVAYERMMTFSDEVWALHLPSLLQKQR